MLAVVVVFCFIAHSLGLKVLLDLYIYDAFNCVIMWKVGTTYHYHHHTPTPAYYVILSIGLFLFSDCVHF